MRVAVDVLLAPHERARAGEALDDPLVRLEHLEVCEIGHVIVESALIVDGADDGDASRLAESLVVLTEAGGHVHDPRPVFGRDEIPGEHAEGVGLAREVVEERAVGPPDEISAGDGADENRVGELRRVGLGPGLADEVALSTALVDRVGDRRPDRQREVRRQRPRRRRPRERAQRARGRTRAVGDRVERDRDGDRRVDALAVGVVLARLEVRERRLAFPAVREDALALVDQPAVVERLEGPDDALHVGGVHRLVIVVEIHPTALAGDVALPGRGVAQDGGLAVLVETFDAERGDLGPPRDAELTLGLGLGGQPVTIPTESTLDAPAAASSRNGASRP